MAQEWYSAMGGPVDWYEDDDWGSEEWRDENQKRYNAYLMDDFFKRTKNIQTGGTQYVEEWNYLKGLIDKKKNEFSKYLKQAGALYGHQNAMRREQIPLFNRQTNIASALQVRGVRDAAAQSAARRGLGVRSGLASAAESRAMTNLGSQALGSQMDFASKLEGLIGQQRGDALQKEFDFANAMIAMSRRHEYEMELTAFQAKLQADLQSRNAFFQVASAIGTVIGMGLPTGWVGSLLSIGSGAATATTALE